MVNDFAVETYAKLSFLDRMQCNMPDVIFYLNEESDYLVNIGSIDFNPTDTSFNPPSSTEPVLSLLQNNSTAQWRDGYRSCGHRSRRSNSHITSRDQHFHSSHIGYTNNPGSSHWQGSSRTSYSQSPAPTFCSICSTSGHLTGFPD